MAVTLGRRIAVLVVAVLIALLLTGGTAFAAPGGNGQGIGQGEGGGNIANTDNGKRVAKGGGQSNNPHTAPCSIC